MVIVEKVFLKFEFAKYKKNSLNSPYITSSPYGGSVIIKSNFLSSGNVFKIDLSFGDIECSVVEANSIDFFIVLTILDNEPATFSNGLIST